MAETKAKILITGATGLLGKRLAKRLVEEGYALRALARVQSDVSVLERLGVEIVFGDLGDESSVAVAVNGVDMVVHAGAGTSGAAKDSDTATIQGTRNVLKACKAGCVRKLIYISSCNVYETANCTANQIVTEEAQLERFPARRGHYSAAKLAAEQLVTATIKENSYPIVVLRPGTLYGPGAEPFTRMMGISFRRRLFVVFGDGESTLPLLHVDSAVDAIVKCIIAKEADGQVFNIVDPGTITKRQYMERVVKVIEPSAIVIYCPAPVLFALTWLLEKACIVLGKQPPLTVYRLRSSQVPVRYSTSKIESTIGLVLRVRFGDRLEIEDR